MPPCRTTTLILALALAATGCAAEVAKDQSGNKTLEAPTSPTGSTFNPGIVAKPPAPENDCSVQQELMYVIGVGTTDPGPATLYSFDPVTMAPKKLAELDGCPDVDPEQQNWPIAMSIDVDGTAWVLFVSNYGTPGSSVGEIYKVDTVWGNCTNTKLKFKAPADSWVEGGLGFIGPEEGSEKDRLFLGGVFDETSTQARLLKLDPQTLKLGDVGAFKGAPDGFWPSRLSGTGDGRLYAFSGTQWAEIDPKSGALKTKPTDLKLPRDRFPGSAIAYWGDDFWVFESLGTPDEAHSSIYRHEIATKSTTEEGTFPAYVTAAGVTTCAPTLPR